MRPNCSEDMRTERSLSRSYLADAASIPTARGELATFAEAQGATPSQVDDIALSSSEALTNVVAHAYTEPGGEIHVSAGLDGGRLEVVVGDEGQGLGRSSGKGAGFGLAIMSRTSEQMTLKTRPGGGFEVHLLFSLRSLGGVDGSTNGAALPA